MSSKMEHAATQIIQVRAVAHDSAEAILLQEQLSAHLLARYGSDGKAGFADFPADGSVFAVAYDPQGLALGCGALRPIAGDAGSGEVKRMHASQPGRGIGKAVLGFLEQQARQLGYRRLRLSTRWANEGAIAFYRAQGFATSAPYGSYVTRPECACMLKLLD
ncbi:MAG TPA: GNAT family N-acetyltransferase [Ideonella sp.]|uniref:GNAT family N-acetyltransferase n=1 Tax=Ideonella sp. TaxID=1929293 RepID=UPI002E301EF6|nr:GNAT family N-acetyltransferase [Ideonella sp.]HEX5686990.1 GNAT family N-acetyltransferase [Ideonella sp.]